MSNLKLFTILPRTFLFCCWLLPGFILATQFSQAAAFQQITVIGKVTSSKDGSSLPGVSVVEVNNPKNGTVSDLNGNYQISVASARAALKFSSVSFKPKTVNVNGNQTVNVVLEEDAAALNDVVIVGYGVQKKANLTGSTETVRFGDAVNAPVTNTSQLIYGKFSGVSITQSSGLPGADASSIVIRGVGTFGSATPLVVIDNIQYSGLDAFNNLAPSDVESISVLKDASASAIYGARGANGVIVVTTKRGKSGIASIDYSGYVGFQQATVVPQYLNAVDYAKLRNERDINTNGTNAPIRYSDANITAIMNGTNPDQYANTNWADAILRTAPIQNHYLSFSGGTDKTTYRVSVGYLDQQAIVRGKFKSKRYNISLNLNSKVKDWLEISNVTNAYWRKFDGPTGGPNAITGEGGIINQFQRSAPTIPVYYSNGNYGIVDGSYQNVNFSYAATNALRAGVNGDYHDNTINIAERLGAKVNFTKELSFETSGSINLTNGYTSDFSPTFTNYDYNNVLITQNLINTLNKNSVFSYRLLNENILRYAKTFAAKHDIAVLLGHSLIYNRNNIFSGSLQGFPSNSAQEFDAGGVLNPFVSSSAYEEAVQSFFGRVNYVYNGKYLFEANIRRDGSSKFGPTHRYGTFPSASAGWRVSEEEFLKQVNWLSDLKLRASWGRTGNDNIANYIYEQSYNSNIRYLLGSNIVSGGVALTSLANSDITWETVEQYDIGIDAGFFKNKLSITADYFRRNSSGVLYNNFPIPASIGVTSIASINAASLVNKGLEVSVNYRSNIRKFNYSLGGSISKFADNRVTGLGDRGQETINGSTIIRIGAPFMAYYGYQVMGVFQNAAEVAGSPVQFGSVKTAPGDLKYADLSGPKGVPDGIVDAYDRTIIGNPYPKLTYNFNANGSYKGADITILFQGVQGLQRLLNNNGEGPMDNDRNNALSYWINRWIPSNPSTTLPRLGGVNNSVASTFYIQDASYLRLKNLELGYTFPTPFMQKIGISKLRLFAGAQNILTFTKMKNFDPEREGTGATDQLTPLYKVYTFGLNIKI